MAIEIQKPPQFWMLELEDDHWADHAHSNIQAFTSKRAAMHKAVELQTKNYGSEFGMKWESYPGQYINYVGTPIHRFSQKVQENMPTYHIVLYVVKDQ